MNAKTQNRWLQFTSVAVFLLGFIVVRLFDPGIFSNLRGSGFDMLQRIYPREMVEPQPVRIVDIDEASLTALGQWPWSRITLAKLVDELHALGAAAIAFDIVFPEADRLSPQLVIAGLDSSIDASTLPDSDAVFAASFTGRPVVTAFATTPGTPEPDKLVVKSGFAQTGMPALNAVLGIGHITSNLEQLNAAASGVGGMNIDLAAEQGVVRQIQMLWTDGERFAPTLSVEALRVAQGVDTLVMNASPDTEDALESLRVGEIEIPISESGMFYVHYRPDSPAMYVPAVDVLQSENREKLRKLIEGHVVFIGTSAVGLLDIRTTALGQAVPGVSIHAQATEQMLSGRFLSRPEWSEMLELATVLLGGLLIAATGALFRPWVPLGVVAACCTSFVVATFYAFRNPGLLLDMTFPLMAMLLTYLASTAYRLAITDKDGRNMRRMFGHYVAPSVLADIERNPQNLKLGGEVRDVTVMFVDIENFTPMSEKLSPVELVNTVNGLWSVCSTAILAERGTIDKFIGDAIMAFWNAPVEVENHQFHAAKAAIGIRRAVENYNATEAVSQLQRTHNLPPLAVRVGLASGPACVGNMGSNDRFDYSVLGDTVNIAARTESAAKAVHHDIVLAGQPHEATKHLALLSAGYIGMKGKSKLEPVSIIIGDEAIAVSQSFVEMKKEHDHLAVKLAENPSAKSLATIRQLLDEVALHNPSVGSYLKAMADRAIQYRSSSASGDQIGTI